MLNLKGRSDKKSKNIIGIIQSCLILVGIGNSYYFYDDTD